MFKKFATIQLLLALATPFTAHADTVRHCNPEKSKPCGMSCISKQFTCHKATTTAVSTPKGAKK
jgi:hypothetical protein